MNNTSINSNEEIEDENGEKKKKPFVERLGDWVCIKCKNLNFSFRVVCNRCQLQKIENNKMFEHYMRNLMNYVKVNDMMQQRIFLGQGSQHGANNHGYNNLNNSSFNISSSSQNSNSNGNGNGNGTNYLAGAGYNNNNTNLSSMSSFSGINSSNYPYINNSLNNYNSVNMSMSSNLNQVNSVNVSDMDQEEYYDEEEV